MKTSTHYLTHTPDSTRLLPSLLLSAILILSACAPAALSPNPTLPQAPPTGAPYLPPEETITPISEMTPTPGGKIPMTIEPGLDFLIQQAVADLSQRLGVEPESIQVLEAKSVTWPDGSLGCPQPGMHYIQVLMDGAYILLHADGKDYPYHSGGSRPPFLCEIKYKDPYPPAKIDITKLAPDVPTQDQ